MKHLVCRPRIALLVLSLSATLAVLFGLATENSMAVAQSGSLRTFATRHGCRRSDMIQTVGHR